MKNLLIIFGVAVLMQEAPTVPQKPSVVHVIANVIDSRGTLVTGLSDKDFAFSEDGNSPPISMFKAGVDAPVSLGILIDDSLSMGLNNRWDTAVNLTRIVIRVMKPDDEFMLMRFAAATSQVQPFTSDRSRIESYLREMAPSEAGTDVIGSVQKGLEEVRKGKYRNRGLVLVSDAEDNGGGNIQAMSDWINTRELPVFTVAVRPPVGIGAGPGFGAIGGPGFGGRGGPGFGTGTINAKTLIEALDLADSWRSLVLETSGIHQAETPQRVADFVRNMDMDLRGQYQFMYESHHVGESWERIMRLRVPSMPDVKVHMRWELVGQ